MLPLLLLAAAADARMVFMTPSAPTPNLPSCLQGAYHGVYGGQHVYLPGDACEEAGGLKAAVRTMDAGMLSYVEDVEREIVWVGHAGVAGAERTRESIEATFAHVQLMSSSADVQAAAMQASENTWVHGSSRKIPRDQVVFNSGNAPMDITLIGSNNEGMFLSVPRALLPLMDTFLPPHFVPVGVAPTPVPLGYNIPEHYAKHLADVTKKLRFDADLAAVVNTIDPAAIKKDIRYLTGEDSDIISRHSFTEGARVAAKWIKQKMETTGANCKFFPYLPGFSPDVICTYPSQTDSDEHVILSGHYDSRGSFGNTRAPGGDDDGSGSGHVLAIANAIATHNITFDKPLTLAFFSGEEQGLWGSHYFAKHLAENNATVILQIQADMLAYHVPGEPMQMGLPESIELPEAGWLVGNMSRMYAPELTVGRTAACCSDHQSFLSYGFPATQVFERNGWIADPYYHDSRDISEREGYDFDQIASIAKVTMASVFEVAGYKIPAGEDLD